MFKTRSLLHCAALLALPSIVPTSAQARPSPSFFFDLRVHDTGGKDVVINDPGDAVTLDIFARISGTDANLTNDRLIITSWKFLSSNSGLLGDLIGLPPTAPFNLPGAVPGHQNDLDGDGDLEIGAISGANANDFYAVRTSLPGAPANVAGGVQIGQVRFTGVQLGALDTQVICAPRPSPLFMQALVDGVYTEILPDDTNISVGLPVNIHASQVIVPGPTQLLSGDVNSHLVVDETVRQGAGATLNLNDGITVLRGGLFDMRNSSGAFGPQEIRVNATASSNQGGALFVNTMKVGNGAAGVFNQTAGLTQIKSALTLGAVAGSSGTLNISGGSLQAGTLTVAAAANGTIVQTGGVLSVATLDMKTSTPQVARYELSGGELTASNRATIGGGTGAALLHVSGTGNANFNDEFILDAAGSNAGSLEIEGGEFHTGFLRIIAGASVNQTGGTVTGSAVGIGRVQVADPSARGFYRLDGGTASLGLAFVGDNARGTLLQTGGTLNGNGNIYVNDLYDLRDGQSQMFLLDVRAPANGFAGRVEQSGGFLSADYLFVRGTYRITGGSFEVNREIKIFPGGTIDFANSAAAIGAGPNSLFELPANALGNSGNASLIGRTGSLINYPAGYNPSAHFGNVQTDGLLHEQGTPLAIPHDKSVTGAGLIQGNVTNGGAVHPGYGAGRLDIDGTYVQSSDAKLYIELGGDENYIADLLGISGNASLNGTLDIAFINNFQPLSSDEFTILFASSITGRFSNANSQVFFDGGRFDISYTNTDVILRNFAAVPEPSIATVLLSGFTLVGSRRRKR